MPGMNGFEATTAIRDYERQRMLIPAVIVALSAEVGLQARARCVEVGMNFFLTKPINMESLDKILQVVQSQSVQ